MGKEDVEGSPERRKTGKRNQRLSWLLVHHPWGNWDCVWLPLPSFPLVINAMKRKRRVKGHRQAGKKKNKSRKKLAKDRKQ